VRRRKTPFFAGLRIRERLVEIVASRGPAVSRRGRGGEGGSSGGCPSRIRLLFPLVGALYMQIRWPGHPCLRVLASWIRLPSERAKARLRVLSVRPAD
jgi:hypothetical protein